jgi:glycosyltransferase involved in cell wall biosynthesis
VSYEKAFEALKEGDFKAASTLLEKAAAETSYESDLINHAYTLALYRAGEKDRLAEASLRIGESLVDTDPGSAMDYFQRAFLGGVDGLDAAKRRRIAEVFEMWTVPKDLAAGGVARPIKKVAHVIGSLATNHRPAIYLRMLVDSLKQYGVESVVFTTEWSTSWFLNPAGSPEAANLDVNAEVLIASPEGDFNERAERIAASIRAYGVDVAFYHGGLNEQITTRVATSRPAAVQVHVGQPGQTVAAPFDVQAGIMPASDIEDRLQAHPPNTRQEMGLESAGSVSATFGNLSKVAGSGYLHALGQILQRFPKHFHLFAGSGDVKAIRAFLHAEEVLPRVRFLGPMSDVAPVMDVIDVYLASFPHSGDEPLLDAMGAGKPVVALRYPAGSPFSSSAEIVGVPELIASREVEYSEIAMRLIRDREAREKAAAAVLARFQKEFHPSSLGPRYMRVVEEILADT